MQRNWRSATRWIGFLLASAFGVCLFSCGSKEIKPLPQEQIHIMKVAQMYGGYRQAHGGKPPANTKEFTAWAKTLKPDQLSKFGVTDLNEALVSPRDGQPYEVAPVSNQRMGMSRVVIYEKTGIDGKHMTASSQGSSGEMVHEELAKLVPNL